MAETNRFAKFVSQKINKIRWRPVTNEIVQHGTYFCTGSWDNDVSFLFFHVLVLDGR